MPRRLLAAGLNSHQQLAEDDRDLIKFEPLRSSIQSILHVTWSTLIVETPSAFVSSGHQKWTHATKDIGTLYSAIGDHNGLLAALDNEGHLYVLSRQHEGLQAVLQQVEGESAPLLSFLAMTGTGRIAFTSQQAPKANLTHIGEFPSSETFLAWYRTPTDSANYPIAHHMIPGRPRQLLAGTGSFAMLMNNDQIFTWGDPRHRSLARSTVERGATAAHKPGLVDGLAGLKLRKIALGGWMGGAVSEDGAAYLWGSGMPGKQAVVATLQSMQEGERVALVNVKQDDGDEPDVIDLDIGDGHAVLLTSNGSVYVAGENNHCQLGLDSDNIFLENWKQVSNTGRVQQVICGPKATFLFSEV